MCGRFTLIPGAEEIAAYYGAEPAALQVPRFNAAPTQEIAAAVHDGENIRLGLLRWGLIPSFAKDSSGGAKMINARAETIDTKPSFRQLLTRRRCLIPADSFYEWKRASDGTKQPMRIQLKNRTLFSFAGLWDRWEHDGAVIQSCTIITTEANDVMAPVHHRMPVIMPKEQEAVWLDRSLQDPSTLKKLLVPYTSEDMEMYPVSRYVNKPVHDDKRCIARMEE
ncbi:SOS response-associated peptidase [Alkalicoccus urumqiensis]|uniref:Abasic site processing protein n=1 Tax=Alkalicoccus urumqiensis TaxID=1548213 RepID=A0A2P6MLF8_ALKUR|nr:SOS response-associated peptidase [Alkalicoccus urumqiensis]PRO67090.1 hypothetical protein C6I21_00540 [Alkalicoccus urumqiensis]